LSSFTQKILEAALTLGSGSFGNNAGNTVTLSGLRMKAHIEKGGHPSKNECKLRIFGMKGDQMNALTTTAFQPLVARKNLLRLRAGDSTGLAVAFQGEITAAWAVYHEPPELYFMVQALSGYYPAVTPAQPRGFRGATQVASAMASLASQCGYSFENNGVDTVVANPYLYGSPFQQAAQLAEMAGLEFGVDDNTLWIAPGNGARKSAVPIISKDTGLIGYPVFDKDGLKVSALYDPAFQIGGVVEVQSVVPSANGLWRLHMLEHELDAQLPGGKWESRMRGVNLKASS